MPRSIPRDLSFLRLRPNARCAVICHRHADVDAYGSAYALSALIKKINPKVSVEIIAPEGLGALAKSLQRRIYQEVQEYIGPEGRDAYFVVDTGHAALLKDSEEHLRRSEGRVVVIDHHPLSKSIDEIADRIIVDESSSSTAEMVYRIFRRVGIHTKGDVGLAILAGILFDAQHLTIAKERTLEAVVELCREGVSLDEAREVLRMRRHESETIARLKGAKRVRIYRLGRWIMTSTNIGSFHPSVARSLLGVGADLAFAVGEHEGVTRGSLRSTQEFFKRSGIHLGTKVATEIAERTGGVGGGHPTAASIETGIDERELRGMIIDLLAREVGDAPREL